jgi:CheY-like chemotaxis protein
VYFSLRLGRPGKTLEAASASAEAMSAHDGHGWTILLAEDDATNAMAVKFYLDKLGHTVRVVENGRQVLEALRETPADCVLMDVQMPVMNGLEAAKAIRRGEAGEAHKNVPIVALTAYAMKNDRERFLAAGMNAHLPKPVSMDVLLATIEKAMSPS